MSLVTYLERREQEEQVELFRIAEKNKGLEAIAQYHHDNKKSIQELETKTHKFLDLYMETGEIEKGLVNNYEEALKQFKKTNVKTKRGTKINWKVPKNLALGFSPPAIALGGFMMIEYCSTLAIIGIVIGGVSTYVLGPIALAYTVYEVEKNGFIFSSEKKYALKTDSDKYTTNLQQLNLYARTLQEQTKDLKLVDTDIAEQLEKQYGLKGLKNKIAKAQEELTKTADLTDKLLEITQTPQLPIPQNYIQQTQKIAQELETNPTKKLAQQMITQ